MNHCRSFALCGMFVVVATVAAGCDSASDNPNKPSPSLTVASSSTATQGDLIAWRVQLRLRVTDGLADLVDAAQAGDAGVEVCVVGSCAEETLSANSGEGLCQTAVGAGRVEIEAAWLDGDQAGVDFCVSPLTTSATYETTLSAGARQSNTIDTACTLSGGGLACVSN